MKQIKNWLFASAFVFALAGAFAFSMPAKHAKGLTTYHYTSNSDVLDDMQNPEYWVEEASGCSSPGDIPCGIEYSDDREEFDDFLRNAETTEEILTLAGERKFKPVR